LQHGVELRFLVDKFAHVRFEPSGFTGNPEIPIAKSIIDYLFRWLAMQFLPEDERPTQATSEDNGTELEPGTDKQAMQDLQAREHAVYIAQADAPPCPDCGSLMIRNGACYACANCGTTSGCS